MQLQIIYKNENNFAMKLMATKTHAYRQTTTTYVFTSSSKVGSTDSFCIQNFAEFESMSTTPDSLPVLACVIAWCTVATYSYLLLHCRMWFLINFDVAVFFWWNFCTLSFRCRAKICNIKIFSKKIIGNTHFLS